MTVERRQFEFNRCVNWFVPAIDPTRRWMPGPPVDPETCILEGIDPARWNATVHSVLTEIDHCEVGRAVVSSIRERTTVYHLLNTAMAVPDTWEAADGQALETDNQSPDYPEQRAACAPTPAVLKIDIMRPPPPAGSTRRRRGLGACCTSSCTR